MKVDLSIITSLLSVDAGADRVVPPTGFTARLTLFTAGAMAFLAVFALALSLASGRLAGNWRDALAGSATLRISAPAAQMAAQTERALKILSETPGVSEARALDPDEQRALLEPWFGPDLPVESLPVPQLIEVRETGAGYDRDGLRLRLQAELPGAVLDDHTRWRKPLVQAAGRLKFLGWMAILLIFGAMGAMITLAANAALAANSQVIQVLRLVGATDAYIARAFVRRFTLRAASGATIGMLVGLVAVLLLPSANAEANILTGLRFQGLHWLWPLLVPVLAAIVAFAATRWAALRVLEGLR
ncbi:cell division protein FtsX [Marinovum sp. 2_MG-2023]|uniref:cell division protein FtsX n=1 Tax=unclassified Marinovum TaxID=2647166 RepID=UPI0026E2FA4C|nr:MULTISPECIES: FtsX-like permease family protein [unclassified Marinovum]MDO6728529.1 cell division protein FtsX [Marinovum sp. 2_MG-2023]MDO6778055.1 cell division protein FtsX [Marinovum sp. 1_MG-2023]